MGRVSSFCSWCETHCDRIAELSGMAGIRPDIIITQSDIQSPNHGKIALYFEDLRKAASSAGIIPHVSTSMTRKSTQYTPSMLISRICGSSPASQLPVVTPSFGSWLARHPPLPPMARHLQAYQHCSNRDLPCLTTAFVTLLLPPPPARCCLPRPSPCLPPGPRWDLCYKALPTLKKRNRSSTKRLLWKRCVTCPFRVEDLQATF